MNSKKSLLLLIIISFSFVSFSQTNSGKFLMFKLYKNATFDLGQTQATRIVSLSNFSPAMAWGEGANFHEIRITSLNFQSRAQTFLYSGGAEYTYNHQFSDIEDSRFQFFFGGGTGFSFATANSSIETANSIFVPTLGKFINLNLVAIPRLTYDIRSNIALELSLSYSFIEFQNSRHTQADPSLPTNGQTNVYNETTPFPRVFSLRLGGIVRF